MVKWVHYIAIHRQIPDNTMVLYLCDTPFTNTLSPYLNGVIQYYLLLIEQNKDKFMFE